MTAATVLDVDRPAPRPRRSLWRYWRGNLKGSEFTWALAFSVPYIAVFLAFVAYPVSYGLWMGSDPALYSDVFSDVIYQDTVVNTLIFVALGVNLKLFLALLRSGVFILPGWVTEVMLMLFVLPLPFPQLHPFIPLHCILNAEWSLLNHPPCILARIH